MQSLEAKIASAEKLLADREARLADTRRVTPPKRVAEAETEADEPAAKDDAGPQDEKDSTEKPEEKPAAAPEAPFKEDR